MKKPSSHKGKAPDGRDAEKVGPGEVTDPGDRANVELNAGSAGDEGGNSEARESGMKVMKRKSNGKAAKATRTGGARAPAAHASGQKIGNDGKVVLQARVRPALHRDVRRKADEEGVTTQTYLLLALQAYGVDVLDEDLHDLRKGEHRSRGAKRRLAEAEGNDPDALAEVIRELLGTATSRRGSRAAQGMGVGGSGLTLIINNHAGPQPDP